MKDFDEAYCDNCMCKDDPCRLIENARTWIKTHDTGKRLFEDVANDYLGAFRPFMMAWCDEFGGHIMAIDDVAYAQGRKAYDDNEIHNPHSEVPGLHGDKLWRSWNRGYNDRRKEMI